MIRCRYVAGSSLVEANPCRTADVTDRAEPAVRFFAHDDSLPLIKEFVGPHPVEESILGKREQHVHDREREQLVGVDEHPLDAAHTSVLVEEAGVTQSRP